MLQAVTEWTVQPSAAFPLRPASEVAGVDLGSRVHFARAGPDMSPEVESLISKATKQARHQCRRGFTLPEHDVGAPILMASLSDCTCKACIADRGGLEITLLKV